jgi:methionine-rich copper-binding protein CopC
MRTAGLVALTALLLGAAPAAAHATLDKSDPPVGSTVPTAPRALTLTFTQKLEPAFSTIEVRDDRGTRVDAGNAQVDPGNRAVLRIGLRALAPGRYAVRWRVLSVDTHRTEGNFAFRVGR